METFHGLPPINEDFAAKANACKPSLHSTEQRPLGIVTAEKDETALLGWKAVPQGSVKDMKVLNAGDSVILDFGGHRTGYFSFNLVPYKHGVEPADSPARLRIIFGEIFNDVAESLEPYSAWLSQAWLPDEIINVDYLPQHVNFPRRHAFRYIRIDIIAVSSRFGVKVEEPIALAVSSAPSTNPPALTFTKAGSDFSADDKKMLQSIDEAALLTLRNCMQTVYEDGPRRDMRLWIGDLRLQALTNYSTFADTSLVKRCLYLFAATPFQSNGLLSASCYEKPHICSGGQSIVDFTQIYAAALLDYVEYSRDFETGMELFPIALKQFELSIARCDSDTGLYTPVYLEPGQEAPEGALWHFIDWQEKLNKDTPSHCVILFGLNSLLALSNLLNLPTPHLPTPFSPTPLPLPRIITHLITAARTHLYDPHLGVFISGTQEKQISWASNAWAVLAGIPTSTEEAARALRTAYEDPDAIIANTPYLHHYLCEAFIKAGLHDLATRHILEYWGSMIEAGAETFWEAWDPKRPRFSPYGDFHGNSFCHAWSCTPALLLRRLGYA